MTPHQVMKILIVDDEAPARRRLIRLLSDISNVEIVAEAADAFGALDAIDAHRLDAVLLDIQMPGMTGLSLASQQRPLPPIIFTTAYANHAVDAFEVNAVDYLLKPIQKKRLEAALLRVRNQRVDQSTLTSVLKRISPPSGETPRISAYDGTTRRVFDARDITRFWAEDKYTLFRHDGSEHLIEESLTSLEQRLASFDFLRVHRGELIKLASVRALHQGERGHYAELSDGQYARVSRRFLKDLRQHLGI